MMEASHGGPDPMIQPLSPGEHTKAGLDQAWAQLGQAGGWFDGQERIAIATQARAARQCGFCGELKAALSPYAVEGEHGESQTDFSNPAVDTIHRIATDPGRLSERWYAELADAGMSPEELVEITSIVGVVTIADTLARALSQPERPLPTPGDGEPHRQPVAGTTVERGWVPMVEPESAEGMLKLMYDELLSGAGFVFNVARALTSVPEAVRDFFSAFLPNYSTHGPVRPGGLDRTQVELLASSTSAWNDCFY
jgi:alkylhydroperoxidase family enzyme